MALKLTQPDAYSSVPLEDVELTKSIRNTLAGLDESAQNLKNAITLPKECYTSEEWFEFEKRAVFDRDWVCLAHVGSIPNPGDYISININDDPMLVVHDEQNRIRVMSAVCPHRGSVIGDARGNCERLVCRLHHWTFDLHGHLLGAPEMKATMPLKELKQQAFLPVLRSEVWNGWVFINMDGRAKPLAPRVKVLSEEIKNHHMSELLSTPNVELGPYPWNWKYMQENAIEPYHTWYLHRGIHDFAPSRLASFYEWDDNDDGAVFHPTGFLNVDANFNMSFKCLFPIIKTLTEKERQRVMFVTVPPNLFFGAVPDGVFYYIILPSGANSLKLRVGFLYPESTMKDRNFEQIFKAAIDGLYAYNDQDVESNTRVHLGLKSRFASRSRYASKEKTLPQMNRWLVTRYKAYADELESRNRTAGGDRKRRHG
jgi:phenylpropionate dioxygenase-like ring-hydroxylating dioxygenase large terminal subunit